MTASVPLSHTTNSIRLAEWWWVLFVGSPSASVRELLQTRAEQPKNGELCNLVPGGTKDVFKTLRLDSLNSLTDGDIWQFCETMDLTPLVLRLQEETVSFYRGLAVNDVYMASSQKLENAASIFTNAIALCYWSGRLMADQLTRSMGAPRRPSSSSPWWISQRAGCCSTTTSRSSTHAVQL